MKFWKSSVLALAAGLVSVLQLAATQDLRVKFLQTPSGIRFSWFGEKASRPSPTLFFFVKDMQSTLEREDVATVTRLLAKQGFISASLDLPCHGADEKPGETRRLACWSARIEAGDSLIPAFVSKATQVLDFLIQSGYTDPTRVAACGISRGGFAAIHFAAADSRVKCVAALAPVTDLLLLEEFAGNKNEAGARALSVINVCDKLVGRGVWVYIGNNDERVGTDAAIAFTRAATRASGKERVANVKLTVDASEGHGAGPSAHQAAADWIAAQLADSR